MSQKLDDKYQRALQISFVFVITVFIQRFTLLPHSIWLIMTLILIYAGFDSSVVIKRAYHRFWGTIFGIILCLVIWYINKWDYRLTIIILTINLAGAIFFLRSAYQISVIFATINAYLLLAYDNPDNFFIHDFVLDRFINTIIAFAICIVSEFFLFNRFNNIKKQRLAKEQLLVIQIIKDIANQDFRVVNHRASFVRKIILLDKQINALDTLLDSLPYDKSHDFDHNQFVNFMGIIHQTHADIFAMYYMADNNKFIPPQLKLEMINNLQALIIDADQWRIT